MDLLPLCAPVHFLVRDHELLVVDDKSANFVKVAGPQLLSGFCNIFLLGVLTVQVFIYHTAFHHDRLVIRTLIYVVYTLEVLQTLLLIRDLFRNFAEGFTDPKSLDQIGLLWISIPLLTGIVTFLCQGLYAYRIQVLFRNRLIAGLVALGCIVQLVFSILISIESHEYSRLSELFSPKMVLISGLWYSSAAICDVIIAICLTYYFFREQNPKDARNRITIQKIARITIGTGALTAAVAIVCCVLTFIPSKPEYYQTSTAILGKLYSNSMLVLLNSRMSISSDGDTGETHIMSSLKFDTLSLSQRRRMSSGRSRSRSMSRSRSRSRLNIRSVDLASSVESHEDSRSHKSKGVITV